jgi:hypothetical protein
MSRRSDGLIIFMDRNPDRGRPLNWGLAPWLQIHSC